MSKGFGNYLWTVVLLLSPLPSDNCEQGGGGLGQRQSHAMGLAQRTLPKTYHRQGLRLPQHSPLCSVSSCFADSRSCEEPFADIQALQGLLLAY